MVVAAGTFNGEQYIPAGEGISHSVMRDLTDIFL